MKRNVVFLLLGLIFAFSFSSQAAEITIDIWTGLPEFEPFYEWAGAEYAKTHPGVEVRVLSTSLREYEQKLTMAIPTGTGPHIFDVSIMVAKKLIDAGYLPPNPPKVDAYLKSGGWSDFSVDYVTFDGKSYGIPFAEGSRAALFYNKQMFKEAGLDPNNPPTTFDELMDYARKLTTYDDNGIVERSGLSLRISGGGSGLTEKFSYLLHNAGGDVVYQIENGKWRNGIDTEAGCKALQFYVDAIHKYKVDDPRVRHDAEAFVTEATAMFLRESWVIGEIKAKNTNLEYGVAPMPGWVRRDTLNQPWPVFLSEKGAKSDVVVDFMIFLTGEEAAKKMVELSGWIPNRIQYDWQSIVAETPQYKVFVNPPSELGSYSDPLIAAYDEIYSKVGDKLVEAFENSSLVDNPKGIKKVCQEIGKEVDTLLKRYGLY